MSMDKFDLKKYLSSKVLLKENMDKEDKLAHKWDNLLEDEMKWELLTSATKNPDKYIDYKWYDLPDEITANIDWSLEHEGQELDEVNLKEGESIFKDIDDDLIYGEASNEDQIKYLESIIQYCQKLIKEIKETNI